MPDASLSSQRRSPPKAYTAEDAEHAEAACLCVFETDYYFSALSATSAARLLAAYE